MSSLHLLENDKQWKICLNAFCSYVLLLIMFCQNVLVADQNKLKPNILKLVARSLLICF